MRLKRQLLNALFLAATILVVPFHQSCLSLASFEDAKVPESGYGEIGGHAGYYANPSPSTDLFSSESALDMAVYGRAGLGHGFGMTFRANLQLGLSMDLKYNFYQRSDGMIAMATGLGFGGMAADSDNGAPAFWIQAPYIVSVHPTEWFTWYGSARFLYFARPQSPNDHFLYFNSGVKIGEKYGLMLESNFVPRWNEKLPFNSGLPHFLGHQQIHIGAFFKL